MAEVPSGKCLTGFSKTQSEAPRWTLVFQLAIPAHDKLLSPDSHAPCLQEAVLEAQSNRSLLAKS